MLCDTLYCMNNGDENVFKLNIEYIISIKPVFLIGEYVHIKFKTSVKSCIILILFLLGPIVHAG